MHTSELKAGYCCGTAAGARLTNQRHHRSRIRIMERTTFSAGFDRRNFISRTTRGIFAATLAPEIVRLAAAAAPTGSPAPKPTSAAPGEPLPQDQPVRFAG